MNIVISNTSDTPIYQQLFDQIAFQIINQEIESGYNMPPIRTASKELRVSVITVKKAWEELERFGFIYTMRGRGCFVADFTKDDLLKLRDKLSMDKLEKDIIYYKGLGLTIEDMKELIDKVY